MSNQANGLYKFSVYRRERRPRPGAAVRHVVLAPDVSAGIDAAANDRDNFYWYTLINLSAPLPTFPANLNSNDAEEVVELERGAY